MARKILVADDEERMRKLLGDFLKNAGYIVLEASDGEEAINTFVNNRDLDLMILDVMMPKLNGYEVCEEIRKVSDLPIIMLTALGEEHDELKGFKLGVDEYISKPFSPRILMARIEAILRRGSKESSQDILAMGGIELDKAGYTVKASGQVVDLTSKEFELLSLFLENPGIVLTREKILNQVWDYDFYGDARTVDTHVKKVRAKLGDQGDLIKTVWGVGYKFEVN